MKRAVVWLACVLAAQAQPWAVTHVTLIDVEAGRTFPDMTVVVTGDHISAVGSARKVKPPRGAQIVDGKGKYLIPGLWDMHVHMMSTLTQDPNDPAAGEFYIPRFLANGITGVRSMFDSLPMLQKLRAQIAAGEVAGPRIILSGPILDGPRPFWPGSIACANAEQGRAAVVRLKGDGVDFLKVYSLLPKDAYLAIAEEARRVGLPFAGHLPNSVTAAEASDAGQKSLEHFTGVADVAGDLYAKLVKNGTWVTPTLAVLRSTAYYTDPDYTKDDRISHLPPFVQQYWKTGWGWIRKNDEAERKQRFDQQLQSVGAMHRAGVKILAGTDTPNPYVFPGTSLHDELGLLVKAGLTPAEALRAATLRPAEYLGMTDRLGTIAKGKLADLVLLTADPLTDIANTRRIAAVFCNGRQSSPR